MKEQEKYEIIKKLVETSGNKDNAALKLSVSRRQINRMMKGYKEQGKAFFVHGTLSIAVISFWCFTPI